MTLLTIGAFARASRLSPKALRLYDDLGLLRPAEVDPSSGYRFYHPDQLERATLVARLRRLGMPLTRIRVVCEAGRDAAAAEIAAYWAQVEAETAARQKLAGFLVDYLCGRATAMSDASISHGIRFAVQTDIGLVRTRHEDSAYAGSRVLAVADGLGGHPGGERASAAAVAALAALDDSGPGDAGEADPLAALAEAFGQASQSLRDLAGSDPGLDGLGTTLTAVLWSGSQLALGHIGDSRAYLLRDGELFPLTQDHTYVRSLVAEGKLSEQEAAVHPQRQLLLKALDAVTEAEPDLSLHAVSAGDRYLLCTDGLHGVVGEPEIGTALAAAADPRTAASDLIALAIAAGAPDNVACAVADIVDL
ncbi:MAG TPA: MerR family transcriptional regulator [Streptosporangiaceae bacterium]